jgi:hypothetical protein
MDKLQLQEVSVATPAAAREALSILAVLCMISTRVPGSRLLIYFTASWLGAHLWLALNACLAGRWIQQGGISPAGIQGCGVWT